MKTRLILFSSIFLSILLISWTNDETVIDFDGNIYHTVVIGKQTWLVEDLRVTHYRNGDIIPNVTDSAQWTSLTTGAFCNYNNDSVISNVYGKLYNWYAVNDPRGLAPKGWHIPTDKEWATLIDFLGGESVAGGKLKENGLKHWGSPNTGATNQYGFTALPAGIRGISGAFGFNTYDGNWWSSTESNEENAWSRGIDYARMDVLFYAGTKRNGLSVRCIKDR